MELSQRLMGVVNMPISYARYITRSNISAESVVVVVVVAVHCCALSLSANFLDALSWNFPAALIAVGRGQNVPQWAKNIVSRCAGPRSSSRRERGEKMV